MLKNIRVRLLLKVSIVLVSILSIALTGVTGWNAYNRHKTAVRLGIMNDISNKLISASAQQALERGTAATALGSSGVAKSDTIEKIQQYRQKGDTAFLSALSTARSISKKEPGSQLAVAVEQTTLAYNSLDEMRNRVDFGLREGSMDVQLIMEWFKAMTTVIDQAARLRQAAFASSDELHQIPQDNLFLKESLWLISENMGRERGLLGPIIAAGKPIPHGMLGTLNTLHELVKLNKSHILSIRDASETDYRIAGAVRMMESGLEQFDNIRKNVYAAAGSGKYPYNAARWMSYSTEAINKVLAVSDEVTKINNEKSQEITGKSYYEMIMAVSLTFLILLFALAVTILEFGQTCCKEQSGGCEPMGHLVQS